jgi:hypothetical protein
MDENKKYMYTLDRKHLKQFEHLLRNLNRIQQMHKKEMNALNALLKLKIKN